MGSSAAAKRRRRRRERLAQETGALARRTVLPRRDALAPLVVTELVWSMAMHALRRARELPPALIVPYLRFVMEDHNNMWDTTNFYSGAAYRTPKERTAVLRWWLRKNWKARGETLLLLLKRSGDAEICRQAMHLNVHAELSQSKFADTAFYDYALQLVDKLQARRMSWYLNRLFGVVGDFATVREARAALNPLVDAVSVIAEDKRYDVFTEILDESGDSRYTLQHRLSCISPLLKEIFRQLVSKERAGELSLAVEAVIVLEDHFHNVRVAFFRKMRQAEIAAEEMALAAEGASAEASDIEAARPESPEVTSLVRTKAGIDDNRCVDALQVHHWLGAVLNELKNVKADRKAGGRDDWFPLGLTTRLSAQLAEGDYETFQRIFAKLARIDIEDTFAVERGLKVVARYTMLQRLVAELMRRNSVRGLKLLERVGLTDKLDKDALQPMELWQQGPTGATPELPLEWQQLLQSVPFLRAATLKQLGIDYLWAQQIVAGEIAIPKSVERALGLPQQLEVELAHLTRLLVSEPDRENLAQRAATLRRRLEHRDELQLQAAEEAIDRLQELNKISMFAAAERSIEECFRRQLRSLVGRLPGELAMSEDWQNAISLTVDITRNRKLLRRLLRSQADGDKAWRDRLPANQKFVQNLAEQGVDTAAWSSQHRKRYIRPAVPGGHLHLRIESDPLKVLQMGNAFGTCLSVGGINSFSTVTNACEANKRVIFARDGEGRVVGRKLIAINNDGKLVGFHTYAGGSNSAANTAICATIASYAREFAARCGLALSDTGEVPLLLAEDWYDDGIVDWATSEGVWNVGESNS